MTRIAIVGGGRAATLHAEAARATPGVELVGVGGRPGTAGPLAEAARVPDLALAELAARADGIVVAVTPNATAGIVDLLPATMPLLVETPVRLTETRAMAMTAVNLLHAATVKQGLQAIADLGPVHHLALRGRAVRRPFATDVFAEPFAGAWPVALMAAGTRAVSVAATVDASDATVRVTLDDGRILVATLGWSDAGPADHAADAFTELEAAGASGVVSIGLWPLPTLEIDGRPVASQSPHPLVALGFVEQMRRFGAVCDGRGSAWPPLAVGIGVEALTRAAARSAAADGAETTVG